MAAKLGQTVCVVDSKTMVGGVCVNTGTIPSKTLREAVMYLTGMQLREMYGASYRVKDEITIADLLARLQHVVGRETEVIRSQLLRNHIELIPGMAGFLDPHTLSVDIEGPAGHRTLTRTRSSSPPGRCRRADERRVRRGPGARLRPDPRAGEGAQLHGRRRGRRDRGRVRLHVRRPGYPGDARREASADARLLRPEIVESLKFHLRDHAMSFRFGEEVASVQSSGRGTITTLASGKKIAAEIVMYSAGRQGNTDRLNLDRAGVSVDKRGRLTVDGSYATEVPHIYAVGDVIGFPALAATSMDQGRLAASYAFGEPARELQGLSRSASTPFPRSPTAGSSRPT
jgi:NAD(P) transhydrogenase